MFDEEVGNIIHAGLIFVVYLFVAILLYYLLSYPVEVLINAFFVDSISETFTILPLVKTALNIAFALSFAFPIVWFVVWVFSREPDVSMFRR